MFWGQSEYTYISYKQCCGSGSAWICIGIGRLDPDPHEECGSWSGSRQAKMTHKRRRKKSVWFWSAVCPFLRGEGLSCRLDVLHGGLGINVMHLLINKILICFRLKMFKVWAIKTLDLDPDPQWPKMLDPDLHWNQCGPTTLILALGRLRKKGRRNNLFQVGLNLLKNNSKV